MRAINAFISEDGSIHTNEGDALRADVLHLLTSTAVSMQFDPLDVKLISHVGLAVIENSLTRLIPLLNRLDDPRNKAARPTPVARESSEAPVQQADRVELPDNHPVPSYVDDMFPDIDPSELREGQLVEIRYSGEGDDALTFEGVIGSIDNDFQIDLMQGRVIPDGFQLPFDFSFITKVLNQPEELMDYGDAVMALSAIPSEPDLTTKEGRLQHTQRILLHSRIEFLEKSNAPE